MLVLGRVFGAVTSLVLVYLWIGSGLAMTVSENRRDASTGMAPNDDQLESTSQMSVSQSGAGRRYTESREVQDHIERLFTPAGRPRPSRPTRLFLPSLEVPHCATEHAYCTEDEAEISEDISDAVSQLLGSNPAFRQQFNATDVLTKEDQTVIQRGPDDPDENHLCGFKVELSRVTWATNEDNVVMRIAQSRDFAQAVRLEHCTNQDCRCHAMFTSGLLRPYRARCKQKYVYRRLLALTEDAKKKLKLVTHNFPLPSCCSCVITKELNFRDGGECNNEENNNNNNNDNNEDDEDGGLRQRIESNTPSKKENNSTEKNAATNFYNKKHLLFVLHIWTILFVFHILKHT